MQERIDGFEAVEDPRFGEVVKVAYPDSNRDCVVVDIIGDGIYIGTSEIVNSDTEEERLALPGTTPLSGIMGRTDRVWGEERIRNAFARTFGLAPDSPKLQEALGKLRRS